MLTISQDVWTLKMSLKVKKNLNFSVGDRTSKKILDFIKRIPKEKNTNFIPINITIIALELGVNEKTVRRHLNKLQKKEYIKKYKGSSNSLKIKILKELDLKKITDAQRNLLIKRINNCIKKVNLTITNEQLE